MESETAPPAFVGVGGSLGKYQLISRLAIGGMAEIFVARATGIEGFEKLVVLKRILPQLAGDSHFIRMFLREARLAATLHHQNIAQVYDIGRVGGTYFFTMEYIHGVDLRHLLRASEPHGAAPLAETLSIIVGAAAGLHHAHDKRDGNGEPLGLVHRDVSPSNVLVGYDGSVKVVDFGIAQATALRGETRPGTIKGKVSYMSPEQCQGRPLDRRSDIFALGIILYELSTGQYLFKGDGELQVMRKIVDEEIPPPSSRHPGYPPELERVVMRALRRDPDERYETAQDLQLDLEELAAERRLKLSSIGLARHLERILGKDLEAWRKAQSAGISLIDYVTSTSSGRLTPHETSSSELVVESLLDERPEADAVLAETPALGNTIPPVLRRARKKPLKRARVAIGITVAMTAAVGAALVVARKDPPSPPAAAASATAPVPATTPEPAAQAPAVPSAPTREPAAQPPSSPSQVHVRLIGLPEHSRVLLDGRHVQTNPITMDRSATAHRVSVVAAGYVEKTLEFVPSGDLTLEIELAPNPPRASKRASTKRKASRPSPLPAKRTRPFTGSQDL
ncbi:MAG: serine/threonine protein kinase [Kofleriaceae bacterium]